MTASTGNPSATEALPQLFDSKGRVNQTLDDAAIEQFGPVVGPKVRALIDAASAASQAEFEHSAANRRVEELVREQRDALDALTKMRPRLTVTDLAKQMAAEARRGFA